MSDQVYFTPHEIDVAVRKLVRSKGIGRVVAEHLTEKASEEVEDAIDEKINNVVDLEAELDNVRAENDELKSEIEELKGEIEELQGLNE